MAAISTVRATSLTEQRLRIAREADAKADQANAIVMANGFEIPWASVLHDLIDLDTEGILEIIEDSLHSWMRNPKFRDTITALAINGAGLAAWTQRQNEILAGFTDARKVQVFAFKEPPLAVPTKAIEYWRKLLGLTDEQADRLASIDTRSEGAKIADRIASALIDRLQKIHDETITEGTNLSEFIAKVREIAPDASRALLETEYRTHMATVYGEQLHEQIVSRAAAFPFTQFFAIIDNRTTDLICRPMGTAGPGGKGYIAASNDPIWIKWSTPCHWRCRSMHSPISYREAQRLGILAKDGRTKIAIVGGNPDRPFGDPPKFAEGPDGELREVKPQDGFGGSGGGLVSSPEPLEARAQDASQDPIPIGRETGKAQDEGARELPDEIKGGSVFNPKVTAAEGESVAYYKEFGFLDINATLEGEIDDAVEGAAARAARLKKHIKHLDDAIARQLTTEDVTVYRGVKIDYSVTKLDKLKPGTELEIPKFVSTSMDKSVAEGFIQGRAGYVLELEVPSGTPALGTDTLSQKFKFTGNEKELLLPRNSRIRIVRVTKDAYGNRVVHAVLVRG